MAPNPTAVAATASIGEDRREEEHMLVTDREQEEEVPTTSSASSEIPPRPPVTPPQPVTPGPAEQADTGAEVLAVVVESESDEQCSTMQSDTPSFHKTTFLSLSGHLFIKLH
ncbi:hypothetical protein SKAU_G00035360 [Synaphobranchus kaupii]|uniref:Uncharacterized protein n=1 Tax=Synaphobranchus kaupii TaxID=118154 RepID=A0A9Q1GFV8_SYNKA|nr:hypothetical protein SKAU_G00035360 [Synaphobranchus kaupii]